MSAPAGLTACRLVVLFGRDHRYVSTKQPAYEGQLYRPLNFARCVRTGQEQIVYEGITGPDAGQWFVCSLDDWLRRFELVEAPLLRGPPARRRGPTVRAR